MGDRLENQRDRPHPLSVMVRNFSFMIVGSTAALGLLVGVGMWRVGDQFLGRVQTFFSPPQPEPQVDIKSLIVQQVRGVSELTTAVFAMQAVVPTSRDRTIGTYTVGRTTLLYIAYGEVRAGIDLAKIDPTYVQLVGDRIQLRLPPPELLDSKIDVTRSTVYDYDRGFLGLGPDVAPQLQELAQRETLETVVNTACAQGILQEANQRAQLALTQLLTTSGYKNVSVTTQSPADDACMTTQ